MKLHIVCFFLVVLLSLKSFSQNTVTEIQTKSCNHFLRTTINYPITGIYLFKGGEPIVELKEDGTGFYQLHNQPKRPINWGMECEKEGKPLFKKGFNTAAYSLWYQFLTAYEGDMNLDWNLVPFTIHFNTLKMFIQGEREKSYTEKEK